MITAGQPQSLTAEVNWGADAGAILWVGSAPVHQFWPLLAPHFGGSFLPPQRRMEGDAVAWTWRSIDSEPPSASDLATLRAQLAADLERFTASQRHASSSDDSPRSSKNRESLALLLALLKGIVPDLLAKSDPELAKYVARTEGGCRIHSWGAKAAAPPLLPEQLGRDVSGTAIHAGRGVEGVEVVLESADQSFKSQARSDESGHFRFANIRRGDYRLRGSHPVKQFAAEGMAVAVAGEALTGLKLRASSAFAGDETEEASNGAAKTEQLKEGARPPGAPRRRWPWYAAGGVVAAAIVTWILWPRAAPASTPAPASGNAGPASTAPAVPPAPDAAPPRVSSRTSSSSPIDSDRVQPGSAPVQAAAEPDATGATQHGASGAAGTSAPAGSPAAGQAQARSQGGAPSAQGGTAGTAPGGAPAAAGERGPGKGAGPTSAPGAAAKQPASSPAPARGESSSAANPKPQVTSNPQQSAEPGMASISPIVPAETKVSNPAAEARWKRRTDLRFAPWRTRLLIDPILPTIPDGACSLAAVAALRQRLLAEQRAKIPPTFSTPHCSIGYRVVAVAGSRWALPADAGAVEASVSPAGANLNWPAGTAPVPGTYSLFGPGGVPLARIQVTAAQPMLIEAASDVRASLILQVALDQRDRGPADRFAWQRTGGGQLPAEWKREVGADRAKLEVPIAAIAGTVRDDHVALFDRQTGWGLTTVLGQTFRSAE